MMAMVAAFVILVLMAVIWKVSEKRFDSKYDEMQRAVLLRGYRYTALTSISLCLAGALICGQGEGLPFDGSFVLLVIGLASLIVFVSYCMHGGAYFGVRDTWKSWTALMALVGLADAVVGVLRLMQEGLPMGRLTASSMGVLNLCLGLAFLIVAVISLVSHLRGEGAEGE